MKPVMLVERTIRNSSNRKAVALDPIGGSGIPMIAAERVGRRARLVELDPKYVDVAVRRWPAGRYLQARGYRPPDVAPARVSVVWVSLLLLNSYAEIVTTSRRLHRALQVHVSIAAYR